MLINSERSTLEAAHLIGRLFHSGSERPVANPDVLIPEAIIVTAKLRAFLSNECGALRLSHALLALGVGLVCWGLMDPSSANDSFAALTEFFKRMG